MEFVEDLFRNRGLFDWLALVAAIAAAILVAQLVWRFGPGAGAGAVAFVRRRYRALLVALGAVALAAVLGPPAFYWSASAIQEALWARADKVRCSTVYAGVVAFSFSPNAGMQPSQVDAVLKGEDQERCLTDDGRQEVWLRYSAAFDRAVDDQIATARAAREDRARELLQLEQTRLTPELRAEFEESGQCNVLFPFPTAEEPGGEHFTNARMACLSDIDELSCFRVRGEDGDWQSCSREARLHWLDAYLDGEAVSVDELLATRDESRPRLTFGSPTVPTRFRARGYRD